MSDASINIKNDALYTITVNGMKDLIKLDTTDLSLPVRFIDVMQKIQAREKEYEARIEEINKREDKEIMYGLNQNTLDSLCELDNMCNDLRVEVDKILGDGVCEAIFGKGNAPYMFNDLFEAIKPEFEKAFKKGNMSLAKAKKSLANKYIDNERVLR